MPKTYQAISQSEKQESKIKSMDPQTTFLTLLKEKGLLKELIPLNSKGRAEYDGNLLKEALKHWFVPTDLIREYYGDNTAMYYTWMNFLISKCPITTLKINLFSL